MKAIEIKFEGVTKSRYSIVANEDEKLGICYLSEKASNFIKAQSQDGKVYCGTEPINSVTGESFDYSPVNSIYCNSNGNIARYNIKADVYDESNPFAMPKEGEWKWNWVELRVIDIMD
jgi:hypothetical protein